jgi:hypothetical protein
MKEKKRTQPKEKEKKRKKEDEEPDLCMMIMPWMRRVPKIGRSPFYNNCAAFSDDRPFPNVPHPSCMFDHRPR